ncbi:hypothetical protein OG455_34380 [Kitasatospora sp. NBC_01287]|uniref:hypothetical protein n=1 Tax=Kitasatospora sp. NBC_01287 TaxID=2903573 RepID=UPI002257A748|nr:hypothetical protein [Kitasatospora sp. NBC_01287]MCX4750542.1 hypothetical protein [Kitasatospora sp. NBC_01287]
MTTTLERPMTTTTVGDLMKTPELQISEDVTADTAMDILHSSGAANMPWFAHGYAADPDAVRDVVLRATGPHGQVAARDQQFIRRQGAFGGGA